MEKSGRHRRDLHSLGRVQQQQSRAGGLHGQEHQGAFTSGGAWIEDITNNSSSVGVTPVDVITSNGITTSLYLLGSVTIGVAAHPNASFLVESLGDAPQATALLSPERNGSTLTFQGTDLDAGGSRRV